MSWPRSQTPPVPTNPDAPPAAQGHTKTKSSNSSRTWPYYPTPLHQRHSLAPAPVPSSLAAGGLSSSQRYSIPYPVPHGPHLNLPWGFPLCLPYLLIQPMHPDPCHHGQPLQQEVDIGKYLEMVWRASTALGTRALSCVAPPLPCPVSLPPRGLPASGLDANPHAQQHAPPTWTSPRLPGHHRVFRYLSFVQSTKQPLIT